MEEIVKAQYGRVKGAGWFPLLYKKDILVLGQGGVGSWLSLLLSRIGCNLHIFDMDIYEEHNMTGQIVKSSGIGMKKTDAIKEVIIELSPDCIVDTYGEYTTESLVNEITLCGFDNMAARKLAFERWREYLGTVADKSMCFFQDGRLNAEYLQILNIPGDREDLILQYETEYLFPDADVSETDCTFKQTSHCAAMIASHMVGFLTNWVTNASTKSKGRQVPFFYDYIIPLNL